MPTISRLSNTSGNNVSSLTISNFIIAAGEDLYVACQGADGTTSTNGDVTGITYNGNSLTRIIQNTSNTDDNDHLSWWVLYNAPNGSSSVVVTYSGAANHGTSATAYAISGGKKSSDASNSNGAITASSPQTNSITTVADNCLVLDMFTASSSGETITGINAPQVSDYSVPNGGAVSPVTGSHYYVHPAGSASFSETPSNTARGYTWAAISIAPQTPGAQTQNNYKSIHSSAGNAVTEHIS